MDARLRNAVTEIEGYYGERLLAAALFGSRAGGRPRVDSDWDLILVLVPSNPIRRTLYGEWDEHVAARVAPHLENVSAHFVHLPERDDEPSSLWLEVSARHEVLHDPTGRLADHLRKTRALVEAGRFERRSVHGIPYWRSAG